jgi:valyl-tRNA synthetase
MNTDTSSPLAASPLAGAAVPDKPTLAGIEDKWTRRWAKERVVQV